MTRININTISFIRAALFAALTLCLFSFDAYAQQAPVEKPVNQAPKIVASGVVNGKAISLVKPEYPPAARAQGVSGAVNVQVTIDEAGNVISAKAVSGHELLKSVAEAAALQAKFKPTTLSGQPVKVSGIIVYNFAPPDYSSKVAMMALSMLLNLPQVLEFSDKEDPIDAYFGTRIGKDLPLIAKEVEPLNSLQSATKEERVKILRDTVSRIEPKLVGSLAWQFAAGKRVAGLLNEIGKIEKDENYKFDETVLKTELMNLKELLKAAPTDFPPALLIKFRELADLADKDDLASPENIQSIISGCMKIFETISPEIK